MGAEADQGVVDPPSPGRLKRIARRVVSTGRFIRSTGRFIREHYMTIDPRTLGVFRIVLGFVAAADLVRHWKEARWFYSNSGMLTNHYHLFRPSSGYNFSFFHAFSSLGEVHVAFAIAFLCHVSFMIGWHTRLFSVLSFIVVTSLDNRLVMVENGGYVVVNLIVGWAMFMPTGRRFSVDALLRSYRERKERNDADLNARWRPAWMTESFVSGIVMLAIVNLAIVYFFNVVNKSGAIWKRGETVHYVLHLDRMVTGVAVFCREHLPLWFLRGSTWSVLTLEGLLICWILAPFGRRYVRLLALLGIWALHTSFGVMMRLGPFSWFLIAWSFLLIVPEHWQGLEAWHRRRAVRRVVVYDASSPLAFGIVRLLARLDALELLRFEASASSAEGRPELFVAKEPETGRIFGGAAALREIVQALPLGRLARPFVALGGGAVLAWADRRRDAIASFFGMTIPPRGREAPSTPSPLAAGVARWRVRFRELLVAYLAACAVSQALNENKSVPAEIAVPPAPWADAIRQKLGRSDALGGILKTWFTIPLKHKQPKVMEVTIGYPRMFQGWGMFAPNPIQDDGSLTIDAITVDGRHIDPFTGAPPDLDLTDARGLGLNQIWQDYFNRIRFDRNKVFRQGLREYLLAWHKETGRPEDELASFDVYWVRDQCPKPGQRKPFKNENIAILTYRKPGYQPPPGIPPLPPEPKVESAGN